MPFFPQLGAVGEFRSGDALAKGCLIYSVGGREGLANLARDDFATLGGTGNGLSTVAAAHGPSFSTDGTANGFATFGTAGDVSPGTGDFTVVQFVNPGSLINSFPLFVTGGVEFLCGGTAGTMSVRFNGSNVNGGTTVSGLNDGLHHLVVFTRQNGTTNHWTDGRLISTGTTTTSLTGTSPLSIGKRGTTATYYAIPGVGLVGYWNRALSTDEIASLTADPFALVRAESWPSWVLKSAAASTQTLSPSLHTNSQTFYAPTVAPGVVTLTPALFTNTQTFYGPTVSATYALTPALVTNTQTFPAATVAAGVVTLTPDLFTNAAVFYDATVANAGGGDQTLLPSLFTGGQTFYSATVAASYTLAPALVDAGQVFLAATVSGSYTLTAPLIVSTTEIFAPTVTASYTLTAPLIASAGEIYAPVVTSGSITLAPPLHANDNTFYPAVVTGGRITPPSPARTVASPASNRNAATLATSRIAATPRRSRVG